MKKRLAIQLFGHVRTFKDAAPSFFKNIISANHNDDYEIDIFIHTWSEVEHNTINYRIDGTDTTELKKTDKQELLNIYRPVSLLIESQLPINEKVIIEKTTGASRSIKGIYNNSYTTFKVNELRQKYEKEHNVKYDWVIQTRPDILFLSPFKIDDFFQKYNELNIEPGAYALYFAHNIFNGGAIKVADPHLIPGTDLIYFSSPEVMNKATSLFCHFDNNFDDKNFWTMEIWWMEFWKKQKLEPIAVDYKFRRDWLVLYKDMLPQLPKIISEHNDCNKNISKKTYIKLFGFIPLLKIKHRGNKDYIYLFNFIPLLKIRR